MYARTGAGPPPIVTLSKNVAVVVGIVLVLRNADAADGAARRDDAERGRHRLVVADALEHGVRAEPAGQLADPLDRLLAALADDVGGAELARRARSGRGGGRAG